MVINGMEHFQDVCKQKLTEWYNSRSELPNITLKDVYIVWSYKTLQNYKCLVSTTVTGDGIYAEYTFNGDREELYEDVYQKLTNDCIKNNRDGWYDVRTGCFFKEVRK